jgi:dynein heavy chain
MANLIRAKIDPLSALNRLKVTTLVTIEVHARDVIEGMHLKKVNNTESFEWKSQLRFEYKEEEEVSKVRILQTQTNFEYG